MRDDDDDGGSVGRKYFQLSIELCPTATIRVAAYDSLKGLLALSFVSFISHVAPIRHANSITIFLFFPAIHHNKAMS